MSLRVRLRTVDRDGTAERLRLAFFRAFIPILLLAIAASEWAVVAWVLPQTGIPVPTAGHVVCPAILWLVNRHIAARRRTRSRAGGAALRAYVAVAFTSVFGVSPGNASFSEPEPMTLNTPQAPAAPKTLVSGTCVFTLIETPLTSMACSIAFADSGSKPR